jgi:N utilization substance protein A
MTATRFLEGKVVMAPRKRKTAKENVKSMFINLNAVLDQVKRDKGIPKEVLVEAIESAMVSAARKKYGYDAELEAQYNEEMGEVELFQFRNVVEEVEEPSKEILIKDAKKLDPEAQVGDELGEKIDSHQFGRIAAQTAKQVIIQKLREAESDLIYNEYKDRVGELITGIARRFEKGTMVVDLGRTEAIIPVQEQVPTENYKTGERIQAYFLELRKGLKGPQLILSRRTPQLIRTLFSMEVPEINEGIVEIKNVSREVGNRAKVAVYSKDSDVDPVGACVGMKGSRVQAVVQELRGEKIDIVTWDDDPAKFVCNAIAPAEVVKVIIHEKDHSMEIIVPDDQLSLAIGRRGQNVRLAAQLTGWNIDIYNETRHDEMTKRAKNALVLDLGIEESLSSIFYSHAFRTTKDIAETVLEEFLTLPGINSDRLKEIHQRAKEVMDLPVVERPSEIFAKQEGERLAAEQKKKEKEEKEEAEKRAAEEATAAENGESTAEGAEPVAENEEEKISEDAESSSTESPVEESSSKEIAE